MFLPSLFYAVLIVKNKTIIALDIGTKTCGVARTDALGITVQPVSNLHYTQREKLFAELKKIFAETPPDKIVVGLPLNMDDSEGRQAKWVREFTSAFKKYLKAHHHGLEDHAWVFWDERKTTQEAEKFLVGLGVSRAKRKRVIDKLAAVMILRSYLEMTIC